jgi:hypothetical protein
MEIHVTGPRSWDAVRELLADGAIVFMHYSDPAPSDQVRQALADYRLAIVILIDTEPARRQGSQAFFPWFYARPESDYLGCGYAVTDPCFRQYYRTGDLAIADYCVPDEYKAAHVRPWTAPYTGWGHACFERGCAVEAGFDDVWQDERQLLQFIIAASRCLLNRWPPSRVIWAASTESGHPKCEPGMTLCHKCYPVTECLDRMAALLENMYGVPVSRECAKLPAFDCAADLGMPPEIELCYKSVGDVLDSRTLHRLKDAFKCYGYLFRREAEMWERVLRELKGGEE